MVAMWDLEAQHTLEFWPGETDPKMVEDERPAQAPALEEPEGFDTLSDDLVLRAWLRAPFVTHGTLAAVCARFKSLLRSDAFRKLRLEYGLAEHGVVCAGGRRAEHALAGCRMLSGGRWRPIPPMSGPRCYACSVIIDNEMWVMGGADEDGNELATVEVYSPKTNSWRSCTPMSQRREDAVAGVVGGRLVVAGGYCDGRDLTSVEAYTGTGWTPLPPMPHVASRATACVLNGRLYVIGGMDSNKLQVLEMTEENGLSWSCKADLPAWRLGAASCVYDGKIWVMGGIVSDEAASVYTYDAEADAWEIAPPLPSLIRDAAASAIEGGIFVCGRLSPSGPPMSYTYRNAAWSEAPQPPCGYSAACGAVLLG